MFASGMHALRTWALAALFLSVSLAAGSPALATVRYTYEGNGFFQHPPYGTFTSAESVSGYFEVAAPLPASMPLMNISDLVLSFAFSNGRGVIEPSGDGTLLEGLHIATDSRGGIEQWLIQALDMSPFSQVGDVAHRAVTRNADGRHVYDGGAVFVCTVTGVPFCHESYGGDYTGDEGWRVDAPGVWTQTPEPSTNLLLGLAFVAIAGFRSACRGPASSARARAGAGSSLKAGAAGRRRSRSCAGT
jgi:hypothetical protein